MIPQLGDRELYMVSSIAKFMSYSDCTMLPGQISVVISVFEETIYNTTVSI